LISNAFAYIYRLLFIFHI